MEEIVIEKNKLKLSMFFVLSFLFVLVCSSCLLFGKSNELSIKVAVYGYAGIIFFGSASVFLLIELLRSTPAIVINDIGVLNNSSFVGRNTLITWSNIRNFKIAKISNQKLIAIHVKDYLKVIENMNFIERRLMKINLKFYGEVIFINLNSMSLKSDELLILLNHQRKIRKTEKSNK